MSGWHSLSGYLHFKAGGAFQKLKTKKRLWFVFEESRGQLLCYKNEADSHSAAPIENVDIKDAAIMLDLEQQNQFIIMCKGKDYIFRAENHESMMIWLLGLQAKQDIYSCVCCTENKPEQYENRESYNRDKLYQRGIIQHVTNNERTSLKPLYENPNYLPLSAQLRPGDVEAPSLVMKSNANHPDSFATNSKMALVPVKTSGEKLRSSSLDKDEDDTLSDAGDEMSLVVSRGRTGKRNSVTGESIRIITTSINPSRHNCLRKPTEESLHMNFKTETSVREKDLEKDLIDSKCEMAKVLNTLTGYQEALSRKDMVILRLDQRVEELELNAHHNFADRKLKELQEHVRILQNKNRFLNKEVKRLAISRRQEQMKFMDQYEETKLQESEVESWKRDYVTLIQSSLHFPNQECTEEPKFVFYGGNHHKEKVCELLEEARKINPSLPLFESLMCQQVHVDGYGFKHMHTNEDMVIHYICQELALHYSMQLESYESRQLQFKYFCQNLDSITDEIWKNRRQMKVLKVLCRKGIPDQYRKRIWCFLINKRLEDLMIEKGPHYFSNLTNIQADCNSSAKYRRQIFVDLLRTMPNNVKFSTAGSKGIMDLRDVLLAYCVHNPVIGYCQGMNFFAAMCLLFLNTEETFWSLVAITECYFPEHYFDYNLIGAQADQALLKDILKETLPKLSTHLENNDIELSTVTLTWFMSIFFDSVPFQTLLRIWDCFFVEGPKVLFRFSLGLLKMHEQQLLQQVDTISVMRHLKCCAKLTFDIDGLVKNAFEKIRPFPKRHLIASKQAHYQSLLRERYRKQLRNRQALLLDDDMQEGEEECEVDLADCLVEQALSVQSADTFSKGNAWFCYGKQSYTIVFEVKCKEGIMYELPIKFDTRVLCAQAVNSQIFMFGTLSCLLYAYDIESRKQLWELRVHDAVLSLNFLRKEKDFTVFAGLADGNLAVIEGVSNKQTNQMDILYTRIYSAPVTALLKTGNNLWCASTNRIFVLSALTLDSVCSFMLSKNPYDVVRCMKSSEHGIWITVKGSSEIELWDPISMTCKMKYDMKAGQYPYPREDDEHLNMQRITWILPHQNVLWVGSGDGNLTIFEIITLPLKNKTETDTERSSDNDASTSYKRKSIVSLSSNWCSLENQSQEVQSISGLTDDSLYEVNMGYKDFQHSLSPIRGSPDGQASNHTIICSSEFKTEIEDEEIKSCKHELSPLNPYEEIDGYPIKSIHENKNMSRDSIGSEMSQLSMRTKDFTWNASVENKRRNYLHENMKLNSTCFKEGQQIKNLPKESFKSSLNNYNLKNINISEKRPDVRPSKQNVKDEKSQGNMDSNLHMNGNSRHMENSIVANSRSEPDISDNSVTPTKHRNTSRSPYHHADSMIVKSTSDLDTKIRQDTSSKLENTQSCCLLTTESDHSKSSRLQRFCHRDMSLDSLNGSAKAENKNPKTWNSLDDMSLTRIQSKNKTYEEKSERAKITESNSESQLQDCCHNKRNSLTEQEIKSLRNARKQFKKSFSTQSSDSAKYVYQGTRHSCKLTEVYHPTKQGVSYVSSIPEFKFNKGSNSTLQRFYSLDQKCVRLKNQESSVNSEACKKLDEYPQKDKKLKRKQSLRSSIAVDSGTLLEKYFADHEAKYRLEFSNYEVDLPLQLAAESSESDANTSEKNSTKSDMLNMDESSISGLDLENLDESYNQKLNNFLEANSDFSRQSSVELIDVCGLNLMAKLKISDRPIACLLETMVDEKPVILSFSGFYGDDEPVLYWTQEASEKMWTNQPLQEICPITKVAKPCGYMKNYLQIHKRNSSSSHEKVDSILNQYQSFRLKLSKTF